jgi:hypothetical protein
MAEVTLEMLQVMVQKVLDGQKRHDQDFIDVKIRLSSLERSIAGLKRGSSCPEASWRSISRTL